MDRKKKYYLIVDNEWDTIGNLSKEVSVASVERGNVDSTLYVGN